MNHNVSLQVVSREDQVGAGRTVGIQRLGPGFLERLSWMLLSALLVPSQAHAAATYRDAIGGWTIEVPSAWSVQTEQGGQILLASRTEAGVILVGTRPKTSALVGGLDEELASFGDFAGLRGFDTRVSGKTAFVGQTEGRARDGAPLSVTITAVGMPDGKLVLAGITNLDPGARKTLERRVKQIAQSVKLTSANKTKTLPRALIGTWWSYSGGSGLVGHTVGTETRLTFCRSGRFLDQGSTTFTGGDFGGAAQSAGGGRWSATGNTRGQIRVVTPSGQTRAYEYQVSGDRLVLDGQVFGRDGGGGC